jgi:hypothetical protein
MRFFSRRPESSQGGAVLRVVKSCVRAKAIYRRRECATCAFRFSTHETVGVRHYRFKPTAAGPVACSACGTLRGTLAHALKCLAGTCSDPDVLVIGARTTAWVFKEAR